MRGNWTDFETIEHYCALFRCYGSLLTERQRGILRDYLVEDLSLSEIAENCGISRQAVHEHLNRACDSLDGFEKELGVVAQKTRILGRLTELSCLEDPRDVKCALAAYVKELSEEG